MRAIDADYMKRQVDIHGTNKYGMLDENIRVFIDQQPTIEPEPHWIPVTERLPFAEYGESNNVLATCGHRDAEDTSVRWIRTLYFNGGTWCYPTGETYDQTVYAWMPLPKPWKGEEND